jgi:hypothetical protein
MADSELLIAGTALAFLIVLWSGVHLRQAGKLHNPFVSAAHKLVAIAAAALIIVALVQTHRADSLDRMELVAGVLTGLLFLADVVSGALLSAEKPMPVAISWVHKAAPVLTVLSAAATFYLLIASDTYHFYFP